MNRTTIVLVFLQALGLPACEPRSSVELVEVGGKVQLVIINCSQPRQVLPVKEIRVRRISANDTSELECLLRVLDYPRITGPWTYGERVEGYEMRGCGPLQPGETYQVDTHVGPVGTRVIITREPNGSFTTHSGGC